MMMHGDEQVQACAGSSSHDLNEAKEGEIYQLGVNEVLTQPQKNMI